MRHLALSSRRQGLRRGQSLIEFAFLAPVLLLLIFGLLDLGRGFYFQTQITDAARDTARVLAAPTETNHDTDTSSGCAEGTASCDTDDGPGYNAGCLEAERDLGNVLGGVSCQQMFTAPPWVAGTDFTQPAPNSALVLIWCGSSSDCAAQGGGTSTTCDNQNSPHACVAVTIAYTFALLTPYIKQEDAPLTSISMQDSGSLVALW